MNRKNSTRTHYKISDLQLASKIVKMIDKTRSRILSKNTPKSQAVQYAQTSLPPISILYGTGFNKSLKRKSYRQNKTKTKKQFSIGILANIPKRKNVKSSYILGWSIEKQQIVC